MPLQLLDARPGHRPRPPDAYTRPRPPDPRRRRLIGWSQRELAARSGSSQSTMSRIECGPATTLDLAVVARVARGARGTSNARRSMPGTSRIVGVRCDWVSCPEEWLRRPAAGAMGLGDRDGGDPRPGAAHRLDRPACLPRRGPRPCCWTRRRRSSSTWAAFSEASPSTSERPWPRHALGAGSRADSSSLALLLDSEMIAQRLAANRDLVVPAFPGQCTDASARGSGVRLQPAPRGWTLATCDPATRSQDWLRATTLGARRRPPAYLDYAEAARRLLPASSARRR